MFIEGENNEGIRPNKSNYRAFRGIGYQRNVRNVLQSIRNSVFIYQHVHIYSLSCFLPPGWSVALASECIHHRHPKRRLADLPLDIFYDRQSVIAILLIHGRLMSSLANDDVPCPLTAMAPSSSPSGGRPPTEPQGGVALPPSAGTSTPCAHGFRDAET